MSWFGGPSGDELGGMGLDNAAGDLDSALNFGLQNAFFEAAAFSDPSEAGAGLVSFYSSATFRTAGSGEATFGSSRPPGVTPSTGPRSNNNTGARNNNNNNSTGGETNSTGAWNNHNFSTFQPEFQPEVTVTRNPISEFRDDFSVAPSCASDARLSVPPAPSTIHNRSTENPFKMPYDRSPSRMSGASSSGGRIPRNSSSYSTYSGVSANPSYRSATAPMRQFAASTAGSTSVYGGRSRRNNNDSTFFSSCIVAVVEGRGSAVGEVGLASICLDSPTLVLCQFTDTRTYIRTLTKLEYFNPAEILTPSAGPFDQSKAPSKLCEGFKERCPSSAVTEMARKYFSDTAGLELIKRLCSSEYASVEVQLPEKHYSLAAAAALLKHLEHAEGIIYAPKSLKVEFQASVDSALLDGGTAKHVNLFPSSTPGTTKSCPTSLFGLLNKCSTPGGVRYLRAGLFQPPVNRPLIESRQDAVQELMQRPELFQSIKSILSRFCDIDQLLSLCVVLPTQDSLFHFEQRLNNVISLKQVLELVAPLYAALRTAESSLLADMLDTLEDTNYRTMLERVRDVVSDNARVAKGSAPMKLQRCFAVKTGFNALLDLARTTYCEIVDDLEKAAADLAANHGLPIKVAFNASRGYHLQIPGGKRVPLVSLRDLPKTFLHPQISKNAIFFTTEAVVQADKRSQEALREITIMSNEIVKDMLVTIRESISSLYKLSEVVCLLDLLMAMTEVSASSGYVRPQFGDAFVVRQGRHPILEQMCLRGGAATFVANDVQCTAENPFHVLTGANMSGKSTYLKQLVLIQVMAQLGCHVPAEFATVRIADAIFSRFGTGDSIECNASTFALEMKEIAYILGSLSCSSLVVLDELGRGTSSEEGAAICWSICEEILVSNAFCFIATHYMLLTRLETLYCNVTNYHFLSVGIEASGQPAGHKMARGIAHTGHYGLALAKASALPREVVRKAHVLSREIEKSKKIIPDLSEKETYQMDCVRLLRRVVLASRDKDLTQEQMVAQLLCVQDDFREQHPQVNGLSDII